MHNSRGRVALIEIIINVTILVIITHFLNIDLAIGDTYYFWVNSNLVIVINSVSSVVSICNWDNRNIVIYYNSFIVFDRNSLFHSIFSQIHTTGPLHGSNGEVKKYFIGFHSEVDKINNLILFLKYDLRYETLIWSDLLNFGVSIRQRSNAVSEHSKLVAPT